MSNDKKDKKDGAMKTPKHTMADKIEVNQEEFISHEPEDFEDRNLDKEGLNYKKRKK